MSLSCQYEHLNFSNYLGDLVRQVSVEARLSIPEHYPKLARVKGGEFRAESPVLTINEGLLIVAGKLNPRMIYLAEQPPASERIAGEADPDSEYHAPQEYGISWNEEAGAFFEERIEIPGLTPEMFVEVDLKPGTALYEKENSAEVIFHGVLDLVIHTALPQTLELVSDIVTQPSGRVYARKEQITVEEFVGVKSTVIPVHTSLLLPSFKPGVSRILDYFLKPAGISSELYNGKVAVKGVLEVAVIYVGTDDEGKPTEIFVNDWNRETETAIPFETFIDYGGAGKILAEPKITAKNLIIENKSQRELRCQLELECDVRLMQVEPKEFVVEVTSEAGEVVDTETSLVNLEEFAEECQGLIDFELEATLPPGVPEVERILTSRGVLEDLTVEAVDNKLLLSGNLNVGLYYIAEGLEDQRLFQTGWDKRNNNALAISGYLDCSHTQPGAVLRSRVTLDTLEMELLSPRALKVIGNIKSNVVVKQPRALSVIQNCAVVSPVDPATRPSMLFYIVQAGDTLWKIARKYQTTTDSLLRANQLTGPERIEPGQKLLIPKRLFTVK